MADSTPNLSPFTSAREHAAQKDFIYSKIRMSQSTRTKSTPRHAT